MNSKPICEGSIEDTDNIYEDNEIDTLAGKKNYIKTLSGKTCFTGLDQKVYARILSHNNQSTKNDTESDREHTAKDMQKMHMLIKKQKAKNENKTLEQPREKYKDISSDYPPARMKVEDTEIGGKMRRKSKKNNKTSRKKLKTRLRSRRKNRRKQNK